MTTNPPKPIALAHDPDARLDRMIEVAEELGVPLDHVVRHMAQCDYTTFRWYSDNPSRLPRHIPSRAKP